MYVCMYVCMYGWKDGREHGHFQEVMSTKFETQMLTRTGNSALKQPTQFSKLHYLLCTYFSDIILDDRYVRDQISVLTNLVDPIITDVPARGVTVWVQSRV